VVVNATGPWVDEIRRLDDPAATPCLRLTKGVHVVVPRDRVGNQHAIVLRSPRDQRILFVLPWEDQTLIGTTDTDFTGPPDTVSVDKEDIEYLLEAVNAFFPRAHLTPADTMGSFAGLRPLVAPDGHVDPSATSREQRILCSPSGLISLAGGKLTTFRAVSEAVTDQVLQHLGTRPTPRGRRRAKRTPLPGGLFPPTDGKDADAKRISERYGARAPEVLALLREDEHLSNPIVAGLPYTKGEVVYAVKAEMAQDVEDILRRRTPLEVQNSRAASEAARDVEAMIASLVDEDEDPYE
jgi:glycerol-3-phosphate dehydrogenase